MSLQTWLTGVLVPLAWPLVVLILVFAFRRSLSSFASRLVEVSPSGLKASAIAKLEQQQEVASSPAADLASIPLNPDPSLEPWGKVARDFIASTKLAGQPDADRVANILASETRRAEFEKTYRLIFGTQIQLLKRLNAGVVKSVEDATPLFDDYLRYSQTWHSKNHHESIDGWLGYLVGARLVAREGNKIGITPAGKQFLIFMSQGGLMEEKPL